jgi:hypothetical protein
MSLLQEMETYGLADCEFNRKMQAIEKSLYWQRHVFNATKDAPSNGNGQKTPLLNLKMN